MSEGARLAVLVGAGLGLGLFGRWAIRRSWGATTAPAVPAALVRPNFGALSVEELDRQYGPLLWEPAPTASNPDAIRILNASDWNRRIVSVDLPPEWAALPPWKGNGTPRAWFHQDVAPRARELFEAWRAAGVLGDVQSWDGDYNPRRIRGSQKLSSHAFGVSFDINASANPWGSPSDAQKPGNVERLVPIASALGWAWGGFFGTKPDPMHFEFAGTEASRAV
jgi:hypothetical protein